MKETRPELVTVNTKQGGERYVVIYQDDDGHQVECPSLRGCLSFGLTRTKALMNIKEAIDLYILALKDDDIKVPVDIDLKEVFYKDFYNKGDNQVGTYSAAETGE